jgi:hypothetical protein
MQSKVKKSRQIYVVPHLKFIAYRVPHKKLQYRTAYRTALKIFEMYRTAVPPALQLSALIKIVFLANL